MDKRIRGCCKAKGSTEIVDTNAHSKVSDGVHFPPDNANLETFMVSVRYNYTWSSMYIKPQLEQHLLGFRLLEIGPRFLSEDLRKDKFTADP